MKLLLTILIASLFPGAANVVTERWVIGKNSNLCITGRSNIAPFQCDVVEYLHADTISLERADVFASTLNVRGGLEIDIKRIDCHHRQITNNLRKTLKAEDNPIMKIALVSIGNFSVPGSKRVGGSVVIKLAGVSRIMEIEYEVETTADKNIQLVGSRQISFSDFNLKTPSKLGGLVKVDDKIQIRFMLVLRCIR